MGCHTAQFINTTTNGQGQFLIGIYLSYFQYVTFG